MQILRKGNRTRAFNLIIPDATPICILWHKLLLICIYTLYSYRIIVNHHQILDIYDVSSRRIFYPASSSSSSNFNNMCNLANKREICCWSNKRKQQSLSSRTSPHRAINNSTLASVFVDLSVDRGSRRAHCFIDHEIIVGGWDSRGSWRDRAVTFHGEPVEMRMTEWLNQQEIIGMSSVGWSRIVT